MARQWSILGRSQMEKNSEFYFHFQRIDQKYEKEVQKNFPSGCATIQVHSLKETKENGY